MPTQGVEEVRSSLASILATFREDPASPAVHFGRHRRDEAVVVSLHEYRRLVAAAEQVEEIERLGAIRLATERLAEGGYSEGTVDDLFAAADTAG